MNALRIGEACEGTFQTFIFFRKKTPLDGLFNSSKSFP